MSPLERLRAYQHNTVRFPSDEAYDNYLTSVDPMVVSLDLPHPDALELRHERKSYD